LFLLVFILPVFLLVACDDPTCPTCGPGGGGEETKDISGKVLDLTTFGPVAGATVEVVDGAQGDTTDENGSWSLEGLPPDQDPLIRISGSGLAPSYNGFPLSLGILQYDLQAMPAWLFSGTLSAFGITNQTPACIVSGAVVRFEDFDYPQVVEPLADAVLTVTPASPAVIFLYLDETGAAPAADQTKTSASGAFMVIVPDATAVTSISLSGSRPGTTFPPLPPFATFQGSFVLAGVIAF
jgi:hypothetical protein